MQRRFGIYYMYSLINQLFILKGRERSLSACRVSPQMPTLASSGLDQSQEVGIQLGLLRQGRGPVISSPGPLVRKLDPGLPTCVPVSILTAAPPPALPIQGLSKAPALCVSLFLLVLKNSDREPGPGVLCPAPAHAGSPAAAAHRSAGTAPFSTPSPLSECVGDGMERRTGAGPPPSSPPLLSEGYPGGAQCMLVEEMKEGMSE